MLDFNPVLHKRATAVARRLSVVLPLLIAILLMSQAVFARNTYLINDGDRVLVHTTYAKDPTAVLQEAGLELRAEDTYVTNSGMGMSEITVRRQQTVTVVCGGQSYTVTTYGETVESLLSGLDLLPGLLDAVSLPLDSDTYDGMTVTVTRCVRQEQTYTVSVPYATLYALDKSLADGQEKVIIPGQEGQTQQTDAVIYRDGKEIDREPLSQTVICDPVSQVVAVNSLDGIDPALIYVPEGPLFQGNAAGNGQPIIGDGLIQTPDGQLLTYTDTLGVVATAYNNTDPGCTDWTATGTLCRVGAIAVDPSVIPYGTRMYIVTNDGQYIYGIAVAEDCGGSIKGNRVDLYFDTVYQCNQFGVRDATIYFLG